mgnify:CR=1 FL=1
MNDHFGIPDVAMAFTLNKEQYERYLTWRGKLPKVEGNAPGFTFVFVPTGIGVITKVIRSDGHELDLTICL